MTVTEDLSFVSLLDNEVYLTQNESLIFSKSIWHNVIWIVAKNLTFILGHMNFIIKDADEG